jgi:hypothetical protein
VGRLRGLRGPPLEMALAYMEYQQRYEVTRQDMANVVVAACRNGAQIPWSLAGQPITVDEYLESRMIAEPMSVLDCARPVTGVGAFVLTSAERTRDLAHRPMYVAGGARAATVARVVGRLDPRRQSGGRRPGGGQVCGRTADCGRKTSTCRSCTTGSRRSPTSRWRRSATSAGRGVAVRAGRRHPHRHSPPVLAGGGPLGNGRMHGVPQMFECYLQLSRRAAEAADDTHRDGAGVPGRAQHL